MSPGPPPCCSMRHKGAGGGGWGREGVEGGREVRHVASLTSSCVHSLLTALLLITPRGSVCVCGGGGGGGKRGG